MINSRNLIYTNILDLTRIYSKRLGENMVSSQPLIILGVKIAIVIDKGVKHLLDHFPFGIVFDRQ